MNWKPLMQYWARCAHFFQNASCILERCACCNWRTGTPWLKTELLVNCLFSDISRVRNLTLNATAAIGTHSSVKSVIERTESLADDASRVMNGPLDLVSIEISTLIYVFPFLFMNVCYNCFCTCWKLESSWWRRVLDGSLSYQLVCTVSWIPTPRQ